MREKLTLQQMTASLKKAGGQSLTIWWNASTSKPKSCIQEKVL